MAGPANALKSVLIGRPMHTSRLSHERLSKPIALAVFASDNLSSSAYATEEMLLVLVAGGTMALGYSVWLTIAIVAVLGLIAFSYRETIHAYPSGGGAYNVAHENLGRYPGLVAAAALLIDYVLTVAVSISAGVAAVVSAVPDLDAYRVPIALVAIATITLLNLRGVRESGRIFAIPTYAFVLLLGWTIVWGFVRYFVFGYRAPTPPPIEATHAVGLFFLMRAFSHGSTAVTGIEAISNGVPAFREPASRNAATTLAIMASILAFLFVGTSVLARLYNVTGPSEDPKRTVVALIALAVFGEGVLFFAVQAATALILFLAANTSYADFPRLGAALATDRFAPRQLMNRGDRLAYSNGILALAGIACVLVVVFAADVSRLINLYVVGVFTSLTLSQFGMVRHWRDRRDDPTWKRNAILNGAGGVATSIVFVIVLTTKFLDGAWMVVLAAPLLVWWLDKVNRHYTDVAHTLRDPARRPGPGRENHVVLLVGRPSAEERRAFVYAERLATEDVRCIHFARPGEKRGVEAAWTREIGFLTTSPSLRTVDTTESLPEALRKYVVDLRASRPASDFTTVILSERIRSGPFNHLGTRDAFRLKTALLRTPDVVVTDVPFIEGDGAQTDLDFGEPTRHVVVLLVSGVHNATLHALSYAQLLHADEVHAVHVSLDDAAARRVADDWETWGMDPPLEVVEAPFRDLGETTLSYVRRYSRQEGTIVTVLLPEFVVDRWWHNLLHNQNGLVLKHSLLYVPDVVVTSVPYPLRSR